jgi:uncharacterized protein YfaP (DUF2135 family)
MTWLLLSAGCAVRSSLVPPSDAPLPPGPGLRVALAWNAPVDLDLYVTDPAAETTYFANRESRSGVRLVRDARCEHVAAGERGLEQVVAVTPMPGRHRIGVDFIDACGNGYDRVPFRVVVAVGDERREVTGEVGLAAFEAVVLEVDVGE